jgi:hypothetical protein
MAFWSQEKTPCPIETRALVFALKKGPPEWRRDGDYDTVFGRRPANAAELLLLHRVLRCTEELRKCGKASEEEVSSLRETYSRWYEFLKERSTGEHALMNLPPKRAPIRRKGRQNPMQARMAIGGKAMSIHPLEHRIRSLLSEMDEDDEAENALSQLVRLGKNALPCLISIMGQDESWESRRDSAIALGAIGDAGAIDALVCAMGDENGAVSYQAGEALAKIGEAALSPLFGALENGKPKSRRRAAHALSGFEDVRVPPKLIGMLKDDDPEVRKAAAYSLGKRGEKSALSSLTASLLDFDSSVRKECSDALRAIGPQDARDLRSLQRALTMLRELQEKNKVQAHELASLEAIYESWAHKLGAACKENREGLAGIPPRTTNRLPFRRNGLHNGKRAAVLALRTRR